MINRRTKSISIEPRVAIYGQTSDEGKERV
jgi:hypothetical protein